MRPKFSMVSSLDPDNESVIANWVTGRYDVTVVLSCARTAFDLGDLIGDAYEMGVRDGRFELSRSIRQIQGFQT